MESCINAPTSERKEILKESKYVVISHYMGKKDLDKTIQEIARRKAYSEI